MLEHHSVFVAEASLLRRFLARTAAPGFQPGSPVAMNIDELALAFEDLPEDIHATVRMALMRPGEDTSLRAAVLDAAKNLAGLAWGDVETLTQQLQTLHVLAHLALHQPYTYRVDQTVVRGARPTPAKLAALAAAGCTTTINLCREMPNGDTDLLEHAGLSADQMGTVHIPVTDCTPPGPDDITTFLETVAGARRRGSVYVHCEAGVGRTGVMIACYRLQQGWDTLTPSRKRGTSAVRCPTRSPSSSSTDPPARWTPGSQPPTNSAKMSHSTSTRPASNVPSHHHRRVHRGSEAVVHDAEE